MFQTTLENQNDSKFNLNIENFEQNWPVLGIIDLDKIIPENLSNTIKYWSYMASRVTDTIKNKSNINASTLIQIIQICRTSVLLSLYSYEKNENCLDPITFLCGMAKPSSTPEQTYFPLISQPQLPEALCKFSEICKYLLKTDFTVEQIINCSIYLSLIELNFYEDESLFNHFSEPFSCSQQIPENETKNILNFESINSLIETLKRIQLKMNQPLYFIIKFIYESLFNYQFNLSYIQDDFYKNIISKCICDNEIQTIIYTCFNYIRGAPIQFDPSKIGNNQILLCFLCLNNLVEINDKETFFKKFSNEFDPWTFFVYAFYNNMYTENFIIYFLDFLEIKELNETWKSALNLILESKDININLNQQNQYLKNIKSLFLAKNDEAKDLPQIPEKVNDDLTAPTLFWYNYHKQSIKTEIIIDLLNKLIDYFQKCLQDTVSKHPIFIHSESIEYHCKYFPAFVAPHWPEKPEDLLAAPPPIPPTNCYVIINLILYQLIENIVQFKHTISLDLFMPFVTNYYIASTIKTEINKLGGDEIKKKTDESKLYHIQSILDTPDSDPDKFECLNIIVPSLVTISTKFDLIVRLIKNNDKYLPVVNKIFASRSFIQGISSLKKEEIIEMLDLVISKDLQEIAKIITLNIKDINIVTSYISSLAFKKPVVALFLYKSVMNNINPSQVVTEISGYTTQFNFSTDPSIAVELINFLTYLSKSIPHVSFVYQTIIKSSQLPMTWEEDSVAKSNEVLTKAFINIWDFPQINLDEIEKAKSNILTSSDGCLHIHNGSELSNSIFEKYCCTFKKGEIIQPCFFCYTCGLVDRFLCCLGCAMTCHRGHDIVFVKNSECQCDCYRVPQMCIFNPNQENLFGQDDLAPPNIEMTLERLHQLIDEGGDISFHQRQFLSALFNNERIQEVHPIPPYLGKDGKNLDMNDDDDETEHRIHRRTSQGSRSSSLSHKKSKSVTITKKSVLDLFLKIASFKYDQKEENNGICKEINLCWQDVVKTDRALDFIPIESSSENSEKLKPLFDFNEMRRALSENEKITYVIQMFNGSPLKVAAFVSNNILVVSSGKSLFSYRASSLNERLSSINISNFITQIIVNNNDPSLIVVCIMTQVYILKVNEDGTFTIQHDKIIKFNHINSTENSTDENAEPNKIVLKAFWLKSSQSKVAVLLQDRMLFYDIKKAKDKLDPYLILTTKGSDSFYSAVIVDHEGEEYVVLTLESGMYCIQKIPKDENLNGNINDEDNNVGTSHITVTEFREIDWFAEKSVIDYCDSTEQFFVISPSSGIAIIKKEDLLANSNRKPFIVYASGAPNNLVFIGNHPLNPHFYIFFHTISGGIITIQVGSSKVFYSLNDSHFDNYRFPIITKDDSILTIFRGPSFKNEGCDTLYSISMNGQLNEIQILPPSTTKRKKSKKSSLTRPVPPPISSSVRPFRSRSSNNNDDINEILIDDDNNGSDDNEDGEPSSHYHDIFIRSLNTMLDDDNGGDNINDKINLSNMKPQLIVPPVFWANSRISTDDDIQITIPSYNRNPRAILNNEKVIFDHSIRKKFIEVTCISQTEVIIGFSFFVSPNSSSSHRPPYLVLNGRITKVDQPRWYMLPLAANEIEERKAYRVEMGSRGGLDINCDGFNVFVIDKSLIQESIALQLKKMNLKTLPKINQSKKHEWFFDSSSLFSFNDSASSYGIKRSKTTSTKTSAVDDNDNDNENQNKENNNSNNDNEKKKDNRINQNLKKFLKHLSLIFSPVSTKAGSKNGKENIDKSVIDDESIKELITLIYTNINASIPARRILLKIILGTNNNDSSENKEEEERKDEENKDNENEDEENKNEEKSNEVESDSVIFAKNKKIIGLWSDTMQYLLKEKKVLPDLWDVFLRDFSLMPKQDQSKVGDLLWENNPPKGNEFAFFSAFVS